MLRQNGVDSSRRRRRREGRVNVVVYAALAFTPAACFLIGARVLDWWVRGGNGVRAGKGPPGPSIERLVSDLHRLKLDYVRIEGSDLPRRVVRLHGVGLAYDDALCACCVRLGVPVEGRPPLTTLQRLELEASLAQRGLTW
jgi:hypothetical protein